jgi:biotin-[acetyl-CoA-carboxylase] ligase BirA-like protein
MDQHCPILEFDSLDSTSSEARRLLAAAQNQPPFAVLAYQQTAGRGRFGRDWLSPQGNLYLTLVFDQREFDRDQAPLSLRIGALVAAWLEERFSIRCTLKWPNDLLYAGGKLGGILIEGVEWGQGQRSMLVGIGLNFGAPPKGLPQAVVALSTISAEARPEDCKVHGRQLVQWLLTQAGQEGWLERYNRYSLEVGQPLYHEGRWFGFKRVEADGQLVFSSWQDPAIEQRLNSAHSSLRWYYQTAPTAPMLVADCGNSRLKLGLFQGEALHPRRVWTASYDDEELRAVLQAGIAELPAGREALRPYPLHLASVNQLGRRQLGQLARQVGLRLITIPKRPVEVDFFHYDFQCLGIDRLALCEGFRAYRGAMNTLLIGAGTATTVEALDRHGVYRGGWILSGLQLKVAALGQGTDLLPDLSGDDLIANISMADPLGENTRTAMAQGAFWETVGGLRELQRLMERQSGETWHIRPTGGWGGLLASALSEPYESHLVLIGLRVMALGGRPHLVTSHPS